MQATTTETRDRRPIEVPASIVKLGFIRGCEHHYALGVYDAKLEGVGSRPIETLIRIAERLGKVWGGDGTVAYRHSLQLLGTDNDLYSSAQIPGDSWDWWVHAADLHLVYTDDSFGCPICSNIGRQDKCLTYQEE